MVFFKKKNLLCLLCKASRKYKKISYRLLSVVESLIFKIEW